MRWLLVALIAVSGSAAGCGTRGSQGPAWPKTADPETDGGESLAPRQAKVAAIEADPDEIEIDEDKPTAATPAAAAAATPAGTVPATTTSTVTPEEVIITEEIIIEIDD